MKDESVIPTESNFFLRFLASVMSIYVGWWVATQYTRYLAVKWINPVEMDTEQETKTTNLFYYVMVNGIYYFIVGVGILAACAFMGMTSLTFLAFFSTIGLAASLGIQKSITNAVAGTQISAGNLYALGSYVLISPRAGNSVEGRVISFDLSRTTILGPDGNLYSVSNDDVITSRVINDYKPNQGLLEKPKAKQVDEEEDEEEEKK